MRKEFFNRATTTQESWNVVFTLSLLVVISQVISGFHLAKTTHGNFLVYIRAAHAIVGVIFVCLLLFFKTKWKQQYSMWLFIILFLPFYVTSPLRDIVFASLPKMFVPMLSYKLYPIMLAFLVPGPYWVNFQMIMLFYVEQIFIWFYLDVPHLKNIVIGSEPLLSLLFGLVTIVLISFKYRDEKIIEKLIREKTEGKIYKEMTKLFLTIRDQNNTPLQNQKLILDLLKKHPELSDYLIDKLEASVDKLIDTSEIMGKFEPSIFNKDLELMDEKEIYQFMKKIKTSAESINQH